jgi:hypothetical protein
MTLEADVVTRDYVVQVVRTGGVTMLAAPDAAVDPVFPDDWWSDQFWLALRDASLYKRISDTIRLEDVPDAAKTRAELDDILAKQASAALATRHSDIVEQATGLPAYLKRVVFADAERNPATSQIIDLAISFPRPLIMHFKHRYKRPRPTQLEPRIRPVVDCPHHAAYPSGHSTQLHLIALVLGDVTGRKEIGDAMWSIADEVAENREYAGLHYQSDSLAGVQLAKGMLPFFKMLFAGEIGKAKAEWG